MKDTKRLLDRLGQASIESPDPFTALILTNFSFHYGTADKPVPNPEWGLIVPKFPCHPINPNLIRVIMDTFERYGNIPKEV